MSLPINKVQINPVYLDGALQKGKINLGVDYDFTYGPTSVTGWFAGINPPSGGYTLYLDKPGVQGPSIYCPTNDSDLIEAYHHIAGTNSGGLLDALAYFLSENDKACCNLQYPNIKTSRLNYLIDPGFTMSWDRTQTILDITQYHSTATINNFSNPNIDFDLSWNVSLVNSSGILGNNMNGVIVNNNIPTIGTISFWFKLTGSSANGSYYLDFQNFPNAFIQNNHLGNFWTLPGSKMSINGTALQPVSFSVINSYIGSGWTNITLYLDSPITNDAPTIFFNKSFDSGINGKLGTFMIYEDTLDFNQNKRNFNALCGRYGLPPI